ncbi:hypothetical protein [Frigidibacter sp. MR17.24]|uniref:hypothetical protein n=1 Tax=Frigidibacter sp. MR17.24 TaxID=3127345 RepID=UPI003012A1DA
MSRRAGPGDPRLAELAALSAMVRDHRLADLAAARGTLDAVEREIAALDASAAATRAAAAAGTGDPRALARHEDWITARRRDLMIRLAGARAGCEAALTRAAPAVGRADVLRQLSERGG